MSEENTFMFLSIIIPIYNEEENLKELLPLLIQNSPKSDREILVVDAASTDQSKELCHQLGVNYILASEASRATQMNKGAAVAKGSVLYFVHADSRPKESFFEDISLAISNGKKAGCYRYKFDSDSLMLKINGWFTRFNGLFAGGGDQTLFIQKSFFEELEGFDEEYCIMEDFDLVKRIKAVSDFYIIPKSIMVSARKYDENSWLRVQIANLVAFVYFMLKFPPAKIKSAYFQLLKHR